MVKDNTQSEEGPDQLVASIVHKNIKTMLQMRQQAEEQRGLRYFIANQITQYVGGFSFALIQLGSILLWIGMNSRWAPDGWRFDPFPYPLLSTLLTAEAIFIAIFILMNQNHMKDLAQKREDLEVQINLLTEHEVTQMLSMVEKIFRHLNVRGEGQDLSELKVETSPEKVLQVIEQEIGKMDKSSIPDL